MEGSLISNHQSATTSLSTIQVGIVNRLLGSIKTAFTKVKDLQLWQNRCFRITLMVTAIILLLTGIAAGLILYSSFGSKVLFLVVLQVAGVVKLLTSSFRSGECSLGNLQSFKKLLGVIEDVAMDGKLDGSNILFPYNAGDPGASVSNSQKNTVNGEKIGHDGSRKETSGEVTDRKTDEGIGNTDSKTVSESAEVEDTPVPAEEPDLHIS